MKKESNKVPYQGSIENLENLISMIDKWIVNNSIVRNVCVAHGLKLGSKFGSVCIDHFLKTHRSVLRKTTIDLL